MDLDQFQRRPRDPGAATGRDTRVVAHRGASDEHPEHTLAAYEQAIADGADALECDVRLTRDARLVCVHDRRVNRTSDGRGAVSALTLDELDRLDFGSWKGGGAEPARVLAFDELLNLATSAPRPVELAVETKHPTRWAGRVEHELVRQLRLFGLHRPKPGEPPRVRLMSFSRLALRRLRALAPELPLVHLTERPPLPGRPPALPTGVRIAGPGIDLVRARPDLVPRLRAAGHQVHVWTVDEPEDVELCLRLGVHTLITNRPRQVLEQIGDR
ncbi:glycerophosphodiester phosphodiesterase family protein [Streptomyces pathocidini]|uniref:Glycerophosphodiester phosphodiesterase family protein n=1 Tax=Streptomyces pathocidini TaxID=1650571 RepID=A0ABW7UYI2_9ACTN|nr:glycerophosphodiester phosphodiesterase family protein [Streptomyces pathocidini]